MCSLSNKLAVGARVQLAKDMTIDGPMGGKGLTGRVTSINGNKADVTFDVDPGANHMPTLMISEVKLHKLEKVEPEPSSSSSPPPPPPPSTKKNKAAAPEQPKAAKKARRGGKEPAAASDDTHRAGTTVESGGSSSRRSSVRVEAGGSTKKRKGKATNKAAAATPALLETEVHLLVVEHGSSEFFSNPTAVANALSNMDDPGKQGERVVYQSHHFPDRFGEGGSTGGKAIGDALDHHVTKCFEGTSVSLEQRHMWMPAYRSQTGRQPKHPDKEANRLRMIQCGTEDGTARQIEVEDTAGGAVQATIVRADGTIETLVSQPGEPLMLSVPSGGWYAMTGPGSGATSSWWHEPLVSDAASFAAIVDIRNVSFSQQQQMMEAAIRYEEAYAKSVGPREPVVHKRLTSVINFDTTKLDKSDGVNRSLGYYQKLVGEGKVEHVAGRTDLEMKAIADQHSANMLMVKIQSPAGDTKLWPAEKEVPASWWQINGPAKGGSGSGDKAGDKGTSKSEKRTGGTAFYSKIAKMLEASEDISAEANIVVCGTCKLVHYSPVGKAGKPQHTSCQGLNKHKTSHMRIGSCECVPSHAMPSKCELCCECKAQ